MRELITSLRSCEGPGGLQAPGSKLISMTFSDIRSRYSWRPIRHCPGRFVLSDGPTSEAPDTIVPYSTRVSEHVVAAAKDPVIVTEFEDGGLLSYRKPDGRYLHTLNTCDGLERKLQQLGIHPLQLPR